MDFSKSVQEAINSSIRDWLQSHWPLGWILANFWLSLLLLLILIILFWGLLGALGQTVQQSWLWLLRMPIKLIDQMKLSILVSKNRLPNREQRIESLIQQITDTQQHQLQLLTELTKLVANRKT
jgi:hypothetical protein